VADGPQELERHRRRVQRCLRLSHQAIRRQRRRAKLAEELQAKTKRQAGQCIKELRRAMAAQSRELAELHLAAGTERRQE
jgi:hypothetical protein